MSSDEGSAYVRLFKQIHLDSSDQDDNDSEEDDDEFANHDAMYIEHESVLASIEHERIDHCMAIQVDANIQELIVESHSFVFDEATALAPAEFADETPPYNLKFDESAEYDFTKNGNKSGEIYDKFEIELGTSKLPRFSCANHKCNIAVRLATKKHNDLSRVLRSLSKYAAKTKHSLSLIQTFNDNKSRLRLDNLTRWLSSFLMLYSFYKAYKKNSFPVKLPCPVSLLVIEKYLLILLPAYQFNLIMQSSLSSIAEVVPSLMIMLSRWKRLQVDGVYKSLCNYLVQSFTHKFEYELHSPVYQVASLLNTSKIRYWYKRPDCIAIRRSAIEKLTDVYERLVIPSEHIVNHQCLQNNIEEEIEDSLYCFLKDETYSLVPASENVKLSLHSEITKFIQMVELNAIQNQSTITFWIKNCLEMPYLKKLALILFNIPSSSAYIERHFSLSGAICEQRRGNMTAELVSIKCLLKANLNILNELNKN